MEQNKKKITIMEMVFVFITILYIITIFIDKSENLIIPVTVVSIPLLTITWIKSIINHKKKDELNYKTPLIFSMIIQESIILFIVGIIHPGNHEISLNGNVTSWNIRNIIPYSFIIIYFISNLVLYFKVLRKKLEENRFSSKNLVIYILVSFLIVPVVGFSKYFIDTKINPVKLQTLNLL